MLRGATVTHEILESITNAFIVRLRDVMNSVKSSFVAENPATDIPSEQFLLETECVSCKSSVQSLAWVLSVCSASSVCWKDGTTSALLVSCFERCPCLGNANCKSISQHFSRDFTVPVPRSARLSQRDVFQSVVAFRSGNLGIDTPEAGKQNCPQAIVHRAISHQVLPQKLPRA